MGAWGSVRRARKKQTELSACLVIERERERVREGYPKRFQHRIVFCLVLTLEAPVIPSDAIVANKSKPATPANEPHSRQRH